MTVSSDLRLFHLVNTNAAADTMSGYFVGVRLIV